MDEKLEVIIKSLNGLSYPDWQRISTAVERSFQQKRKELDCAIKLSSDEIVMLIQSQFG